MLKEMSITFMGQVKNNSKATAFSITQVLGLVDISNPLNLSTVRSTSPETFTLEPEGKVDLKASIDGIPTTGKYMAFMRVFNVTRDFQYAVLGSAVIQDSRFTRLASVTYARALGGG